MLKDGILIQLMIAFFGALPELVKLVNRLERMNKEQQKKKKVKDDIKKINEAFDKNDANALKRVFSNRVRDDKPKAHELQW